jgi:hypothetical protein
LAEDRRSTDRSELFLLPIGPLPVLAGRAVDRIAICRGRRDRGVL